MQAGTSAQLAALDALVEDEEFLALEGYTPPFSILGALGYAQDELAHSRLIAALFNPQLNPRAEVTLHHWMKTIARELSHEEVAESLHTTFETLTQPAPGLVTTFCERDRIDVVVKVGGASPAVVGIENKIHAGEGRRQLAKYQAALDERYPSDHGKVLVFLTPEGREPETSSSGSNVPCVPLGYQSIAEAAEASLEVSDDRSPAIAELIRHIREEIMGNADVKDRAWSIWRNHSRALRILLEHRPKLHHIREAIVNRLELRFGEDAEITFYPRKQRDIDEIKFSRRSWATRGCNLVFMMHTQSHGDSMGRPRLRVLVRDNWYQQHHEMLEHLADKVNEADGELAIDRSFQRLPHWSTWRRVLDEDLYPRSAVLDPVVIPGETDMKALERIERLIDRFEPHIDAMPDVQASKPG